MEISMQYCLTVATIAALNVTSIAQAENKQPIDDFTVSPYTSEAYQRGTAKATTQTGEPNHIVGGTRSELLYLCDAPADCASFNPFGQYSSYAVGAYNGTHALVQTTGFKEGFRLELSYGGGAAMAARFGRYDRIRVNFIGLTGNLNFNILAFTGNRYGQNGCNVPARAGAFSVEFPFSGFTQPGAAIDFNDISTLDFIFQSGSAIGGVSFGVTSIEVSDTQTNGSIQCDFAQRSPLRDATHGHRTAALVFANALSTSSTMSRVTCATRAVACSTGRRKLTSTRCWASNSKCCVRTQSG
jgi:hypothetical protein